MGGEQNGIRKVNYFQTGLPPVRGYEVVLNVCSGTPPEWRPHILAEDAYTAEDAVFQAKLRFSAYEHTVASVAPSVTVLR